VPCRKVPRVFVIEKDDLFAHEFERKIVQMPGTAETETSGAPLKFPPVSPDMQPV